MFFPRRFWLAGLLTLAAILAALLTGPLRACPFCSAIALTFSEEIGSSNAAVIAKLVKLPAISKKQGSDPFGAADETTRATFEIVDILKGEKALGKTRTIETVYFGDAAVGTTFLIMGVDGPPLNWSTPIALSERGRKYIAQVLRLPKEGNDRMAFFQDYLEDSEELLGRDAYDEFAKTPYSGVKALKDRLKHDQVLKWVTNPEIPVSRRRLYLTMLGVCGTEKDIPLLEQMLRSEDRQTKAGLDALVAAYLTLKGPDGMKLIEDLFLKDPDAEYTETYATIMALRFHGQEEKVIPRERLLEGLRTVLERPRLADLVIPDLARWQDWSAMDRLVALFKAADDDESSWVRVPVINYLRACPLPAAKQHLDELAKIDPEVVKRASTFFPFGGGAAPVPAVANSAAPKATSTASGEDKPTDKPADKLKSTAQPAAVEQGKVSLADGAAAVVPGMKKRPAKSAESARADADNWRVLGGIAVAAVLLLLVFLAILRGGSRAAA